MNQVGHRILLFDHFALDLTRGCLRAGDHDIELRPKTFEVLRYLAENAGRLVSKQELYQAVCPDVTVSDENRTSVSGATDAYVSGSIAATLAGSEVRLLCKIVLLSP